MSAIANGAREAGRPQVGVAWFGILVAGVITIYGIGIALGVRGDDKTVNALACAITFFGFLPLVIDQALPPARRHLLITLISGAWIVYFAVPVWTIYFMGGSRIEVEDVMMLQAPDIIAALSMILVAQVLLLASYATPLGRILGGLFPKVQRDWDPDIATGLGVLMVPLGLALFVASSFGIIPSRLGAGALGGVVAGSYYGVALLTIVYLRTKSRPALLALYFLVPLIMTIYFFTGMKEKFFMAPIHVVIAIIVTTRRINAKWILVGFIAFMLFYPVSEIFRRTGGDRSMKARILDPSNALRDVAKIGAEYESGGYLQDAIAATTIRLSALQMTAVVIHDTPERVPFQGGWSLSYIVITFVPRLLWPGKPIFDVGQWVTDNYGSGAGNLTSTGTSWLADFYMNFGWSGVIIGMIGMGLYFRILHEILFTGNSIPTLLAASVCAYHVPRSLENFAFVPISGLITTMLPFFFLHYLVRNLGHNAPPPATVTEGREFGVESSRIEA